MKTKEVKPAKLCFEHIGGKLGELLLNAFIEKQWIARLDPSIKHFYITKKGIKAFSALGIDLALIKSETW